MSDIENFYGHFSHSKIKVNAIDDWFLPLFGASFLPGEMGLVLCFNINSQNLWFKFNDFVSVMLRDRKILIWLKVWTIGLSWKGCVR